ncbi:minor tail protein [Propionibacterium phage PHL152M00]|uniref:Minor tail protein n=1 Tax=Propionibacterium phage PHL152M00 TaxID=1500825 RepID=A0A0E3DMU5_9CAUD|nr:minor tail protein [Propionibacterium phage PHL152M00]AII29823.1 hypothetical protein PHL152M00_18 [Propionibacterium phage PHL152M00]
MVSWFTPALVASICTALATILGSVQAVTSRSRKRLRRLSAQVDAMEEYTWGVRREVRRFNAGLSDNVDPLVLPDPPGFLKDTVDGGGE